MLGRVNEHRKSLLDSIADLLAFLGAWARNVLAFPRLDSEPAATADPDFEDWLRNDVKVIVDPAHRYGGESGGFLGDSAPENPLRSRAED